MILSFTASKVSAAAHFREDPDGDRVSQDEFEDAFRAGRRLRATAEAEENGKKFLSKLLEALGDKKHAAWFEESNVINHYTKYSGL
ncbi:hypothetical protein TrLO_g4785 [Triparma laevis f. longispina]|uniref:Uncharacterized protein n=1 Tax=Triparma laevis f. longispina TaxID=1714387 RepID=A0A9W7EAB6_9STRA|nr:hypothetical protein TrLO_g4785 [Triparma laevis f. longispina]